MNFNATPKNQQGKALSSTYLFGTPIEEADGSECREIAKALWRLLDDITTASDMFKPTDIDGYKAFYRYTMKKAAERGDCLESDGYNLYLLNEREQEQEL